MGIGGLFFDMAENSDYENFQYENEKSTAFTLIAFIILVPIELFLYFRFLEDVLPLWLFFIFLLVSPFIAGASLKKWVDRNSPPPKN
jgi:hypothetical protein